MAYGKKPTKPYKPKMSKRKSYASKAPSATLTRQVRQIVNKQAETKSHIVTGTEISCSSLTSPTATNVIALNYLGQGSTIATRAGNKITPTFLNVRGGVHIAPDSGTQYLRLLIVEHDESDNPTLNLLELDTSVFSGLGNDLAAIYDRLNRTRYRIYAQKTFKLGGGGTGYFGQQLFNFNVKLKGNMYFENTPAAAMPTKRNLKFIFYCRDANNDTTVGTSCEVTYNSKFYYTDM